MKKIILILTLSVNTLIFSQVNVSTIEDYNLAPDTFYNGSDGIGGFSSGNIYYPSVYDNTFSYWASGFAASNMKDSVTSGYTNLYSAKTSVGYNNSPNYVVGQNNSILRLIGASQHDSVYGFYITNSTYAYNSMRDGDAFSKKFGGTSGNDPDYFLLSVKKYLNGMLSNDSVIFYLADFRFSNNANDYILKDWQWVNCKSLGKADSLLFQLSSSDVGQFGMNTPGFFAADNLTTKATFVGVEENSLNLFNVYPIPTSNIITIENLSEINASKIEVLDISGKQLITLETIQKKSTVDLSVLPNGIYHLKIISGDRIHFNRIIKN
ncbi:MAG: DUF4465 domain-containing protein [Bacteroidota bacterium]